MVPSVYHRTKARKKAAIFCVETLGSGAENEVILGRNWLFAKLLKHRNDRMVHKGFCTNKRAKAGDISLELAVRGEVPPIWRTRELKVIGSKA